MAKKLRPFLAELRPLARDARPTLSDLSTLVRRPGGANDLIELTNLQVPRARTIAARQVTAQRQAARGRASRPRPRRAQGSHARVRRTSRPYTPDLLGWFDDFSHSGVYDALGGVSRVAIHANPFALTGAGGAGQYELIPPELRDQALQATLDASRTTAAPARGEHKSDDGTSPYKPTPDFPCDPSQVLPGQMRRVLARHPRPRRRRRLRADRDRREGGRQRRPSSRSSSTTRSASSRAATSRSPACAPGRSPSCGSTRRPTRRWSTSSSPSRASAPARRTRPASRARSR